LFRPVAKTDTIAAPWWRAVNWRADAWPLPANPKEPANATAINTVKNRLIFPPFHKGS
jgi:hypothetical protein